MKFEEKLNATVGKLIDERYAEISENIRDQIKLKAQDLVSEKVKNGLDVTIQVYDKTANSQNEVRFMKSEPKYFNILNIES